VPKLSAASREYYEHLTAKGGPASTAKGRLETLRAFERAVGDIDTARVEPRHVDQMFTKNRHWSAGTRNNRLSHLNLFFKWCRFRRYMPRDNDPTYGWSAIKYAVPDKLRIPRDAWPKLFAACQTPIETMALASGLYLFLRGSEQQRIQLKHVHLDKSRIEIYRIKNKKWAVLPIPSELEPYLRAHLTWMAEQGFTDPDHYLLISRHPPKNKVGGRFIAGSGGWNPNRPFSRPYTVIQGILDRAGYPTFREGEHTLRRSGARAYFDALLDRGYDGALMRVQTLLGHERAEVTERYLGVSLNQLLLEDEIAGKPMFPALSSNIVPIREARHG
jgi:integrase